MYYGDLMLFDEAGKLEKGERIYLGDVKGKNEGWLLQSSEAIGKPR